MITFNSFRSRLNESTGVLERTMSHGHLVVIDEDFTVIVDDEKIAECDSLIEAKEYAKTFVANLKLVENLQNQPPVERVIELIREHHGESKITDSLVNEYISLHEDNAFTIDPVLLEMKTSSQNLSDKLEFTLKDGNVVAISEETISNLSAVIQDKYQIVEYMQKSKENFMHVLRKLS